jgi:hypothetical protein
MFNKAQKELKKAQKRIAANSRRAWASRLYNGWDITDDGETTLDPYYKEYEGVSYQVFPQWYAVEDAPDWELSHHVSSGYSIVKAYEGEPAALDFRFLRAQDIIMISVGDSVKEIKVNVHNLYEASIKGDSPLTFHVYCSGSVIDVIRNLKEFVEYHADVIGSLDIIGINNALEQEAIYRSVMKVGTLTEGIITFNGKSKGKSR